MQEYGPSRTGPHQSADQLQPRLDVKLRPDSRGQGQQPGNSVDAHRKDQASVEQIWSPVQEAWTKYGRLSQEGNSDPILRRQPIPFLPQPRRAFFAVAVPFPSCSSRPDTLCISSFSLFWYFLPASIRQQILPFLIRGQVLNRATYFQSPHLAVHIHPSIPRRPTPRVS